MNPRAEASERVDGRYEPRVLEPSPPAASDPPWFADDPVARGDVPAGRLVLSPVASGDLTWEALVGEDASLADWCAARWLAAYRRLGPTPAALVATRTALHRLAEETISPARREANGKIGLRYTRAGFGTPFFGDDQQLRVEGDSLVVVERARELSRTPLDVDSGAAGARAAYGLSPGDETHPEPYAYVAPWAASEPGELWNATGFAGAELPYALVLEAEDQRQTALAFFRARLTALT
jgi:hypothetical protein